MIHQQQGPLSRLPIEEDKMGLEDRQYYRDEHEWGRQWTPGQDQRSANPFANSMVIKLIMINVGIAILDLFTPSTPGAGHTLSDFMALNTDVLQKPWMFFTLLTYGFAHSPIDANLFHLLGNMLVLFFLGRWVEYRLGAWEFLRFYLVAIVIGGLAFLISRWVRSEPGAVVGASGAVSAVLMLFVFMYPKQTVLLFFVLPVPAWVLGGLVVVSDLLTSFDENSRIAWESHLAGLAFGAAYQYFGWNLRWLTTGRFGEIFKSRPKLKVHSPEPDQKLKSQADEILKKIAEHGEESLSARERRILNKYSKQIRRHRD